MMAVIAMALWLMTLMTMMTMMAMMTMMTIQASAVVGTRQRPQATFR
jgi:hypothetical protein